MGVVFFLAFLLVIVGFLYGIYSLIAYVVRGIAYIKIAPKLSVSRGWMGFVPVANCYLLGRMAEEDCKRYRPDKKVKKWRVIYPIFFGIYIVLNVLGGAFFFIAPLELTKADMEWDRFVAITDLLEGVGMLIFLVSALLGCIVTGIVLYKFYHVLAGKSATWMLALAILVPVSRLVLLLIFAFSKKFPKPLPVLPSLDDQGYPEEGATAYPKSTVQEETENDAVTADTPNEPALPQTAEEQISGEE